MNLIVQERCSAKESSDYKARQSQSRLFVVYVARKHSSSMAGTEDEDIMDGDLRDSGWKLC